MKKTLAIAALLVAVGCSQADQEEATPETPTPSPFFASPPPSEATEVERPDYTVTLTAEGTGIYVPPAPPPAPYDPCAVDPITGNVQDGDCFGGIPVD
jgi:hypothetical protein